MDFGYLAAQAYGAFPGDGGDEGRNDVRRWNCGGGIAGTGGLGDDGGTLDCSPFIDG